MTTWQWVVASALLLGGMVLAVATTTDNRLRWAVLAPAVFGTATLFIAIVTRDWGPITITAGMYFYAAINFRARSKAGPKSGS